MVQSFYMEHILPEGGDYNWLDLTIVCLQLSPLLLEAAVNFHSYTGIQLLRGITFKHIHV